MFSIEQKLDALIKLLKIRVIECNHPDSYSGGAGCTQCKGIGWLLETKAGNDYCHNCEKKILSDDQWELLQESLSFQRTMRENACVCE